MKKSLLLLSLSLLTYSAINAQVVDTTNVQIDSYNRWSIELSVGQSKGVKPYADGYYSSNPNKFFGRLQANSFGIGARYMVSPKFGLKAEFKFDKLNSEISGGSLPFEMHQYRLAFEGVTNAIRLFNIEEAAGRFGLLLHGGIQLSRLTSKTKAEFHNYNLTESDGGIILGFSPQVRITKTIAIIGDVSILSNYRQHLNWDGSFSDTNNNLSGQMISTSLGLSFSFGSEKIHGDWAIIQDKNKQELDKLDNRIGDLETMMNDADKDGVADYLDLENNSLAGVAVDTKGRMIDLNNNGVADELEKYLDKTITNNNSTIQSSTNDEVIKRLINEGYISAYFDTAKSNPNDNSTDNIGFVLNYLRRNPTATVEIRGFADEIGQSATNDKLALKRAEKIQNILKNTGIDASRVTIVSSGEDKSVDKNSAQARKLVRRVTFTVK